MRAAKFKRQSSDPSGLQFGVDRQNGEIDRYTDARGSTMVADFRTTPGSQDRPELQGY